MIGKWERVLCISLSELHIVLVNCISIWSWSWSWSWSLHVSCIYIIMLYIYIYMSMIYESGFSQFPLRGSSAFMGELEPRSGNTVSYLMSGEHSSESGEQGLILPLMDIGIGNLSSTHGPSTQNFLYFTIDTYPYIATTTPK